MSTKESEKKRKFVELDVGGRIFKVAPSTLGSNSIYFQDLLRDHLDTPHDEPIFVDQDPDPFADLLSFMRIGCMQADKLTTSVLLLAEFLGMDRLLSAVKFRAFCNLNPCFPGSEEEAIRSFDAAYSSIREAIASGKLPKALTTPLQEPKEYCSLVLFRKDSRAFINAPDGDDVLFLHSEPVACVCLGWKPSRDGSRINYEEVRGEGCITFLDCLNWLSKNGFRTYERDVNITFNDVYRCWKNLIFSRISKGACWENRSDLSKIILDPDGGNDTFLPEKRYALLVPGLASQYLGVYIKADVGNQEDLSISIEQHGARREASTISMECGESVLKAMGWLQKWGYTKRETPLEEIFEEIVEKHFSSPFLGGKLQLYSRIVTPQTKLR